VELARSAEEEKQSRLKRLREFQAKDPEDSKQALERVRQAAMNNENVFAELMHAMRYCSLGQITQAMFEVGAVLADDVENRPFHAFTAIPTSISQWSLSLEGFVDAVMILHLRRKTERKASFVAQLAGVGISDYEIVDAFDGFGDDRSSSHLVS
jgi:hypothetical protein